MFVIARNRAISPETAWEENAFGCAICSQPRFAFEIWDLGSSPKIHGGCFLFVRIALVRAYLLATTAPLSLLSLSWPLPFFFGGFHFLHRPCVCPRASLRSVGRSAADRRHVFRSPNCLSPSARPNSRCRGRTVRTAPSSAFPASAAPTPTRPRTRPRRPGSARTPLLRCRRSPCRGFRPWTRRSTGPPRGNRIPLRFGPSPGACTKVGVSRNFLVAVGGGWGECRARLGGLGRGLYESEVG